MSVIETLINRNGEFAASRLAMGPPPRPALRALIVGCVDPRVDPAHVLGVELGEAVVIRNLGGRITPDTLRTMALLGAITRVMGVGGDGALDLVVLHHTDCGITRLAAHPDLLAGLFGVAEAELAAKAVLDPYASVIADVAMLRASPALPAAWLVSGLVYDVATGRVETVVAPAPLREASPLA